MQDRAFQPDEPTKVAVQLRLYNQWRRGEGAWEWRPGEYKEPPFEPHELGELIERAAFLLDMMGVRLERMKHYWG